MSQKWRVYCITENANVFEVRDTAPTACVNNAAHTINTNSICIVDGNLVGGGSVFGDGSDGDVAITVNTTLVRDMYYRNLTITNATVSPAGYRIFISDTLTMDGGTISANGSNAVSNTAGSVPYIARTVGTGASGGAGGAATGNGSGGGSLTALTRMGGLGGAGGGGLNGVTPTNGGNAGSATVPADATGGVLVFKQAQCAIRARDLANTQLNGGGSGGGGGGGGSGTGGGGGSGGGVIILAARYMNILTTGTFTANGGNGAAPAVTTGGGGGGGGGGCIVIMSTADMTVLGTFSVDGGSGGLSGGTGTNGTAGSVGQVFKIRM